MSCIYFIDRHLQFFIAHSIHIAVCQKPLGTLRQNVGTALCLGLRLLSWILGCFGLLFCYFFRLLFGCPCGLFFCHPFRRFLCRRILILWSFGRSRLLRGPALRLPVSIQIGGMAVTLGALVGLVLGIIGATVSATAIALSAVGMAKVRRASK